MKSVFRFIIGLALSLRARLFIRQSGARVIGITGSVGKTSTTRAVSALLEPSFRLRTSHRSFNTPLGLSLSILDEPASGFSSVRAWAAILWRTLFKKKAEKLDWFVLEMGADHPGDLRTLMRIAPPHIGIVTAVAPVHLAEGQFKTLQDIAHEKETLVRLLPPTGVAVLNADDTLVATMRTGAIRISYGTDPTALVSATDVHATHKGVQFTVHFKGHQQGFTVPVLGSFQIHVLLPAIAVALHLGLTLAECARRLATFSLPPGRMNLLDGKNDSHLIDGSYNASPATTARALELLAELRAGSRSGPPWGRKIAALGTMNELGERTHEEHLKVGRQAAAIANLLIAVGPEAPAIKQGAIEAGMGEEAIFTFFDSEEAGHFLQEKLQPKDLVLIKGSQNRVRMEKMVKLLLRNPEKAPQILCRQEKEWQEIP